MYGVKFDVLKNGLLVHEMFGFGVGILFGGVINIISD